MAQIVINIPNDKLPGVIEAFSKQYNYSPTIPDPNNPTGGMAARIPNPVTEAQFAKQCVLNFIKQVYISQQAKTHEAAIKATVATATADVNALTVE